MYEKIFRKEYKEMIKIWAIFEFLTSISIENSPSQVNWLRNTQNKNLIFLGFEGLVTFFRNFCGSGGLEKSLYHYCSLLIIEIISMQTITFEEFLTLGNTVTLKNFVRKKISYISYTPLSVRN